MPTILRCALAGLVAAVVTGLIGPAIAEDPGQIEVIIKDHRFTPSEVHVPAGKPTTLLIRNTDDSSEEFDSTALKVEKVIVGGAYGTVRLRPLAPGRYPFMGEFHPDTATGVVVSE